MILDKKKRVHFNRHKFEIRISKHETISNDQNSKSQKDDQRCRFSFNKGFKGIYLFEHLNIRILNLFGFRASNFEFIIGYWEYLSE
jgi:hypothetical protein